MYARAPIPPSDALMTSVNTMYVHDNAINTRMSSNTLDTTSGMNTLFTVCQGVAPRVRAVWTYTS